MPEGINSQRYYTFLSKTKEGIAISCEAAVPDGKDICRPCVASIVMGWPADEVGEEEPAVESEPHLTAEPEVIVETEVPKRKCRTRWGAAVGKPQGDLQRHIFAAIARFDAAGKEFSAQDVAADIRLYNPSYDLYEPSVGSALRRFVGEGRVYVTSTIRKNKDTGRRLLLYRGVSQKPEESATEQAILIP